MISPDPAPPRPKPALLPRSRQVRRLVILGVALVLAVGLISGISLAAANHHPGVGPGPVPSESGLFSTIFITTVAPPPVLPTAVSVVGASEYPCSDEGNIQSVGGGAPVSFTFINQSSKSVQIIWLNFAGARQTVDTLSPRNRYKIHTYIRNVWMIASSSSSCLFIEYINGSGSVKVS